MEEILSKDIFSDKVLLKFAPDYDSTDIVMRMHIRRDLVRDTDQHDRASSSSLQGKRVRRKSNEILNVNKEIVKMKSNFIKHNMKNEIMLKHSPNNISKSRKIKRLNDSNINSVLNISDACFLSTKCNHSLQINESGSKEMIYNELKEDIICHEDIEDGVRDGSFDTDNAIIEEETISNFVIENSAKPDADNLQSFLIMMALSSNETDEIQDTNKVNEEVSDFHKEDPKQLILVSSSIRKENKLDFLNITPLKSDIIKRQLFLLKKYVDKWKLYIQNKHESLEELRKLALNNFFDKLEKKKSNNISPNKDDARSSKSKLLARDYKTYQHKYKAQKHIIALQKAKLEEQNRVIEELKYNKIIEASKHSVDAMKEEVRKTYYEIDRHLKPKIKCLTNELNLHEIEEPSLVLHCLKVPQFLQRMEKRARERDEKHAIIRERRRQMEEERLRLKQQAEIAKAEMDKEEKIRRIKELKEKRKKEKIESIRRKQHAERMRSLKVMVDLHYERNLMLRCGIRPWMKLIKLKRDNLEKAKLHYLFQLQKNVFLHWMWYTEDMLIDRNYRAEDLYKKKLLRISFDSFRNEHHEYVIKKQVAEDYYEFYLLKLVFEKLQEGFDIIKKEGEIKLAEASAYYHSNLLFRVFTLWRTLPALNALKREQEARKMKWRQKVLQVVPDYEPPDD